MKHYFEGTAHFSGGYESHGTLETRNMKTAISIPASMGGVEIGTNPDEMLLGAATTCFIISLSVLFERNRIPLTDLKVESKATVNKSNGVLTYESIDYIVTILTDAPDSKQSLLRRFVRKAEESCMITRALKGNVDVNISEIHINP
ncbi:OsmC family protein [Macrococcus brunensis]|uniref:OsmC family protein n=1 Tax=Macrococcus brunensis TaxID=198483 RepID=UPI001EEF7970|nr:OsmC family protein [Macrococcus brunensis]ULG71329.1 OsmC family protein [Macrococcus brunensis]